MKTLYHYTSLRAAVAILNDGRLRPAQSPIGGPPVIWLTSDPNCAHDHGLLLDKSCDRQRVRFTIKIPNAYVMKFRPWALARGIDRELLLRLVRASGGGKSGSNTWRVVEHQISEHRWIEVWDRRTDLPMWRPAGRRDATDRPPVNIDTEPVMITTAADGADK